jgi:hypothetical protein
MLTRAPWDLCFVITDVEQSLSNWYDMFMSIVNDNVPKLTINNANDPSWMDTELRQLLREKNIQRRKALKSQSLSDFERYKLLRIQSKQLISKKKKKHALTMRDSVFENPKRFWSYIKRITKTNQQPNFLRDEQNFVSDPIYWYGQYVKSFLSLCSQFWY